MADASKKTDKKKQTDYMKENPFIQLSSQTHRTRRNMLIFSMLCWFQVLYNSQLGGTFKIWGTELTIPKKDLNIILMTITLYFTVYFIMLGWKTFSEWKLRSTGLRNSEANRPRGSEFDLSSVSAPIEQTTFITIFTDEEQDSLLNAIQKVNKIDMSAMDWTKRNDPNVSAITDFSLRLNRFNTIATKQLLAFEESFWKYQRKTYWTFMVLDYLGPITIVALGLVFLFIKTFDWLLPLMLMPSILISSYGLGRILAGKDGG